jgi:hypothetical protein
MKLHEESYLKYIIMKLKLQHASQMLPSEIGNMVRFLDKN